MSKNNQNELLRKMQPQKQRYGLRKLTIGVASVLLGTTILIGGGTVAHADGPADTNTDTTPTASTSSQKQTVNNGQTVTLQSQNQTDTQSDTDNQANDNQNNQQTTDTTDQSGKSTTSSTDQSSAENTQGTPIMVLPAVNPTSEDAITINVTFQNNQTFATIATVDIPATKGETLKKAVTDYLKAQLDKQEAYYGPDGKDYMYDGETNKKIGVSPEVADNCQDPADSSDPNWTDVETRMTTWGNYKKANFPLAGYEWDDSGLNTDETLNADSTTTIFVKDPGNTHYAYNNYWKEIDRKVEFKEYYSNSDTQSDEAKENAKDITNADTEAGKLIHTPGFQPVYAGNQKAAIKTSIGNMNSTTSTVAGHPITTDKNNQLLYQYVTQRTYDPVTGKAPNTSGASSGTNSAVIQFPAVNVDKTIGDWTAFNYGYLDHGATVKLSDNRSQYVVDETGSDNFDTAKGTYTYGFDNHGNFIRGNTIITNPGNEYIFYYHNQPVKVVFEDVTNSTAKTLSTYSAKELNVKDNSEYNPTASTANVTSIENRISFVQNEIATASSSTQRAAFQRALERLQQQLVTAKQAIANPSYTPYSYQADSNKYSNATIANDANGKLSSSSTDLDYNTILQAYEKAGYVLVSADPDDLTYDKDKVWDNSNNTHTLLTQTVTVKLRKAAKAVTAIKQVNRTIHYVANNTSGDELLNDSTQTVNLKASGLYLDGSQTYSTTPTAMDNIEVQDADGNTYYVSASDFVNTTTITDAAGQAQTVFDPTNTAAVAPAWTIDTSKTNDGTAEDSTKFDFAKVATPDQITDSTTGRTDKDKGATWQKVTDADSVAYDATSTDRPADGYVIYNEVATPKSDTQTLTRTIHYVPSADHTKRLQDDTTQSVTFKGSAYTDSKGNLVNVKQVKNSAGKTVDVVDTTDTATPKETWTVDSTATNTGLTNDDKDFATVTTPATITLSDTDAQTRGVKSGYWNYVDGASQAALFNADGTPVTKLDDGYVEYNQDETTQTKKVNEVIHYVKDDGTKAADDYNATSLTFTRTGTKDKDGHTIWGDWTKAQNFADQNSPSLTGYTPDITTVPAINVTVGTSDKGLTSNDTDVTVNGNNTDAATVVRKVTYKKNAPSTVTATKTVNETIHYKYSDGRQASPDKKQSIKFTRTGSKDAVTGDITWNAWQPAASQTLASVESPAIKGYTPDKTSVAAVTATVGTADEHLNDSDATVITVNGNDANPVAIERTVIYTKQPSTPVTDTKTVTETIHYKYSDGTTAAPDKVQKLTFTRKGEKDPATGEITWGSWTPAQSFNSVTSPSIKGYTPDLSEVAKVTVNATDDDVVKTVIYTKQPSTPVTDTRTVTETIHYKYSDGKTAAPDKVQTLTFTRQGEKDPAIGEVTWGAWTPAQSFDSVVSPSIKGYTPDLSEVAKVTVNATDDDVVKTVIYTKQPSTRVTDTKTVTETIHYKYSDGRQAAPDKVQTLTFTRQGEKDPATDKITWGAWTPAQSFNFVTSPTIKGYTPDLSEVAKVTVNATDDDVVKTVIYTKQPSTPVTDTRTVTETIHYKYRDGRQAAPDKVQKLTFARQGKKDPATDKVTWGNWTPAQSFGAVTSPTIKGYTADPSEVCKVSVEYNSANVERTVIYTKNSAPAPKTYTWTVHYQTADGTQLQPDKVMGTNYHNGDSYDVDGNVPTTITIDGKTYELVPSKTVNGKGKFGDANGTTTVTYQLKSIPWTPLTPSHKTTPEQPTTPTNPTTPSTPSTPTSPAQPSTPETPATPSQSTTPNTPNTSAEPQQPAQKADENTPAGTVEKTVSGTKNASAPQSQPAAKKLPQTGNHNEGALLGLGLGSIAAMLGLAGKKREED